MCHSARHSPACNPGLRCPTAAWTSSSAKRGTKIKRSILRGTSPASSGPQEIYRGRTPPSLNFTNQRRDLDSLSPDTPLPPTL